MLLQPVHKCKNLVSCSPWPQSQPPACISRLWPHSQHPARTSQLIQRMMRLKHQAQVTLSCCRQHIPKSKAHRRMCHTLLLWLALPERSRSAQASEEDDASRSSSFRQAGSPSRLDLLLDALNKSAKRAKHGSPQSDQQAELPTALLQKSFCLQAAPALSSWWCVSVEQSCLCSQTQNRNYSPMVTQSLAHQLM